MRNSYFKAVYLFLLIPVLINIGMSLFFFLIFVILPNNMQINSIIQNLITVSSNFGILYYYWKVANSVILNQNLPLILELKNEINVFLKLFFKNHRLIYLCLIGSFLLPFVKLYFHLKLKAPYPEKDQGLIYYFIIPFFLGPFIEEWLFRKTMYNYYIYNNIRYFSFSSALFFTILHGYNFNIYSLISFFISLIFAYFFLTEIYQITKSTFLCIINHILYNVSTFLFSTNVFLNSINIFLIIIAEIIILLYLVIIKIKQYTMV
jgi:hypothetical protein